MNSLFEKESHASIYAKYRSLYGEPVIQAILDYAKSQNVSLPFNHVLDIACGSGQATKLFVPYAKKITGIDVSPNQVSEAIKANPNTNVSYIIGTAENIPLGDASVDILNCAAALHWLDFSTLIGEAKRVLGSNGILSIFSYKPIFKILNIGKIRNIKQNTLKVLRQQTDKILDDSMASLPSHPATKTNLESYHYQYERLSCNKKQRRNITMTYDWSLGEFYGFIRSLSSYQKYQKLEKEEIFQKLQKVLNEDEFKKYDFFWHTLCRILSLWRVNVDEENLEEVIFMIFACKPFHVAQEM